ncbi:MAG: nucleotidyltransferase domain-containing protein [candidate division WOR-3 bacterium]|nr:nucleotidyltransferase domain-containing protein [candidate division WOR-3 bacterium]
MTTKDRLILEQLKVKVAQRLPLSRIVLFGSRARGDNEPDSDVDVLVLLEGSVSRESEEYVRSCAWELSYENGVVIFPLVVARAEWEEGLTSASLLAVAVGKEGVEV